MQVQVIYYDEAGEVAKDQTVEADSPHEALKRLGFETVCMNKSAPMSIPTFKLNDMGQKVIAFKRENPAFVFDPETPAINLEGNCEIKQHYAAVVAREAGTES